jgi:UDP-N-acetylglucosamine transferase subunit ALG13
VTSGFTVIGSVGTDHHPFPRFLEWVAAAQRQLGFQVLVQRGYTDHLAGIETVDFMSADELEVKMTEADVVVCHGGPGTMSMAIRCGHRPIVVARDPQLGEHVDDHQQRYTAKLASEGSIDRPLDQAAFVELIRTASERPRASVDQADEVGRSVQRFAELMDQLETGRLPRRRWRDRVLIKRVP